MVPFEGNGAFGKHPAKARIDFQLEGDQREQSAGSLSYIGPKVGRPRARPGHFLRGRLGAVCSVYKHHCYWDVTGM